MEQKRIKYKTLELDKNNEGNWIKKTFFTKSALFVLLGVIASSTYYYFTEWQHLTSFGITDTVEGIFVGALIGYFIANNPCANNRC